MLWRLWGSWRRLYFHCIFFSFDFHASKLVSAPQTGFPSPASQVPSQKVHSANSSVASPFAFDLPRRRITALTSHLVLALVFAQLCFAPTIHAQPLDLLIRGGHVIDPKNGLDGLMDIGISDGKIAVVAPNILDARAKTVADASGLYVTPGLVDLHVHVFFGTENNAYLSNSFGSIPPDGFTFRAGVTTVVDAGGAGWRNFSQFKEQTVDHSKTRVLAFLNIVGSGMKGGRIEQNLDDMDPVMTARIAEEHPGLVVGVKVAHYQGHNWSPVDRAVEAGKQAGIPVMVDFGGSRPELSLKALLLEHLRPGDIFTHTFANVGGRTPIVDTEKRVRPFVFTAQKRGIIFDVGHGGSSFLFSQARPAAMQKFWPNSISTDLHRGSMNGSMKTLANVMSKFLNLGMGFEDVILRTTWSSAQYIKRPDLGHLDVGAVADLAVFRIRTGDFGFVDAGGHRMPGTQKLETELTVREGMIVWDLNGISRPR